MITALGLRSRQNYVIMYKMHVIINFNLNCACVFCRLRSVRSASLSSLQKQVNVAACVLRALVWRAAVVRKTPSVSRVKMVSVFNLNLNKCLDVNTVVFPLVYFCIIDKNDFKSLPGVSFSDSENLSACRLCARCPAGIPELARCTPTQDTHCDCGERFFLWRDGNSTNGLCTACSMCGHGSGVVRACGPLGNTVCERCQPGTYSKERSDRKPCVPCSRCTDDEVEIRPCQPDFDTVCMGKCGDHYILVCIYVNCLGCMKQQSTINQD